jgi:hypothetical protein
METPEVKAQRLLEQYYNLKEKREEETPDGYMSIEQLMKAFKCTRGQVFRMMRKLENAGKVHRILLRKARNKRFTKVTYFK